MISHFSLEFLLFKNLDMKTSITRGKNTTHVDLSDKRLTEQESSGVIGMSGSSSSVILNEMARSMSRPFLSQGQIQPKAAFSVATRRLRIAPKLCVPLFTSRENEKKSFMGLVSKEGSFFPRSPQQMSPHDSLVQTELLDHTVLCTG